MFKKVIQVCSNTAYLKTKVDMLFFTIKHCQILHSQKVMAHWSQWENVWTLRSFFGFYLRFDPAFFPPFSLSFSLFFCLFLGISNAGPFEPHLIGVDWAALQRYNGKSNIFGPKIWPFFLLWKPFVPFFYMLESWCSYYYYPTHYRIKWYWNWKIACINLAERSLKKCWTAITHR